MHMRRAKIDSVSIENTNYLHRERLAFYKQQIAKIEDDPKKKERIAKQQCAYCFESSRIGGAAITTAQCAFCDKRLHSGNTNIDQVCLECAKYSNLCVHCGGDIDTKNRRKRPLKQILPTIDDSMELRR